MVSSPNLTSEELNDILKKVADRKARDRGVALLFSLIVVVLLAYLLRQNLGVQSQLKQQIAQGQQQIIMNQESSKLTLNAIQRRGDQLDANMRCIALLFTAHPAGTITIIDFNNCKIQSDSTINTTGSQSQVKSSNPTPVNNPAPIPTPAPSPSPSPQPKSVPTQLKDFIDNVFSHLGA